jgi:hypothetical protein
MNRRSFIQSLAAVFALPAMPLTSLRPVAAGIPAAADVPARVKSWAVYMSDLHGECTPLTLQRLLHIPEADAKSYVGRLIADGVLRPNPLLQQSLRKLASPDEGNLPDTVVERLEVNPERPSTEVDAADQPQAALDADRDSAPTGQSIDDPEQPATPQYPSSSPLIT